MDRLLQTSQKGVGHPLARTVGGQLIKKNPFTTYPIARSLLFRLIRTPSQAPLSG